MRSGGAITPYLSDTCALPFENKANGCDTPLCDTISKGYCAIWGGISHWAAKFSSSSTAFSAHSTSLFIFAHLFVRRAAEVPFAVERPKRGCQPSSTSPAGLYVCAHQEGVYAGQTSTFCPLELQRRSPLYRGQGLRTPTPLRGLSKRVS